MSDISDRDRRPEPEIIPPGAPLRGDRRIWVSTDTAHTHYVYTKRLGPVSLALMTLAGGAIAALAILFLLGTAVIGLAAIGVLTIAGVIAGLLRGPPRQLR
ncbi:MAG TPA: hypothetical protein VG651_05575 [Stellaceae bacterium]|nr:hypothetical protein [Stellaceae bacterium]